MKSEKRKAKRKNKSHNTVIIAVVAIILLAGIGYVYGNSQKAPAKTVQNPVESLKETRKQIDAEYSQKGMSTNTPAIRNGYVPILSPRKADKLPDYVYQNSMTLSAYKYATEHPEVVEQMPCYCGCGEHGSEASEGRPHRFLRDCFITDKGEYDSHASYCDICVGLNIKAQSAAPQGI